MQIFLMYLIAVLMLLFTVSIHEIGHFFIGRQYNVNVKEVSIGIGPTIWQKITKKDLKISIKLIPLIAYVLFDSAKLRKIYEEDFSDSIQYGWIMKPVPEGKLLLENTKTWQYVLIMLAGVFVNFLCFLVLWPICFFAFNQNGYVFPNPFISLGKSLTAICYCMVFKGGSGSNIFVEIPDFAGNPQWGLIFFQFFVLMNLVTAVFNIIPIPPLDGWKILSRVYTHKTKKQISEKIENTLSLIVIILMFYIFVSSILVKWIYW